MNLIISGHHLELTPSIREYVETKLERIRRHFDHVIDVAVILGVEKPSEKEKRQRAEVNLRLRGNVIHVESFAEDLYAAIDLLIDKLDRQVLKYKTKVQDHQHEGIKRMPEQPAAT
ncbi:MAG TPA: ribosome-associated translation inhibitor RaiA [Noviherbaspirillum sp.]|nr:ribosome-associated translation inhibitor RaiA [Noviherbaspirillum sp.]